MVAKRAEMILMISRSSRSQWQTMSICQIPGNRNAIFLGRSAQILVKRCKRAAQFFGQQQISGIVG